MFLPAQHLLELLSPLESLLLSSLNRAESSRASKDKVSKVSKDNKANARVRARVSSKSPTKARSSSKTSRARIRTSTPKWQLADVALGIVFQSPTRGPGGYKLWVTGSVDAQCIASLFLSHFRS